MKKIIIVKHGDLIPDDAVHIHSVVSNGGEPYHYFMVKATRDEAYGQTMVVGSAGGRAGGGKG